MIQDRQLHFLTEFMAGVAEVEHWHTDQAIIPVRFFNLKIELDTRRGDIGEQFSLELGRLAIRIRDMQRAFDQARVTVRFPGGFAADGQGRGDKDDDEEED